MALLWEIAGWAGAAVILAGYLGVSMSWFKASKGFQVANLLGAVALIINGALHEAWPSAVLNIAWCLISVIALYRMRSATPATEEEPPTVYCPSVVEATTGQFAVVEALARSAAASPTPPSGK